jgi:hypothetical protein
MSKTFTVTTVDDYHRFDIATRYMNNFNQTAPSFLEVYGDDDFEDGETTLRIFNLDHVVDYGWE